MSARPAFSVEALEARDLPAVTATLTGGLLKVVGTAQADTITVRQVNNTLAVAGVSINSGGQRLSSVPLAQVTGIEINALGGNDTVSLYPSGARAVTLGATVRGGAGDDIIYGGKGNDKLYGNAGQDEIWGYQGDDLLGGGIEGVKGADVSEFDLLEGGVGFDTFIDGFDFNQPGYVGPGEPQSTFINDIQQREAPTCVTLASIVAVANQGFNFLDTITVLGNNQYRVALPGLAPQTVTFDGSWNDNDPAMVYGAPYFWVHLVQRARLQTYGIDMSKPMTTADWNTVDGGIYDMAAALKDLTGRDGEWKKLTRFTAQGLHDALYSGQYVTASSATVRRGVENALGVIGDHAYAVLDAYQAAGGQWMVSLYNPWGSDGNGKTIDAGSGEPAADDGFITLTWQQFSNTANYDWVAIA